MSSLSTGLKFQCKSQILPYVSCVKSEIIMEKSSSHLRIPVGITFSEGSPRLIAKITDFGKHRFHTKVSHALQRHAIVAMLKYHQ